MWLWSAQICVWGHIRLLDSPVVAPCAAQSSAAIVLKPPHKGLRNILGMAFFSQPDVLNDDHENERKYCGHTVSSVVVTDEHTLYEPMLLSSYCINYEDAIRV